MLPGLHQLLANTSLFLCWCSFSIFYLRQFAFCWLYKALHGLNSFSNHTSHPPKGQHIAACLSHQLLNLCRLGSCFFIPASPYPKMPEILLPFHSLNQNWKLLSHWALICQLAAVCWAIVLWITWKASPGQGPRRVWDPLPIHDLWRALRGLCRDEPCAGCWKLWQASPWLKEEQGWTGPWLSDWTPKIAHDQGVFEKHSY